MPSAESAPQDSATAPTVSVTVDIAGSTTTTSPAQPVTDTPPAEKARSIQPPDARRDDPPVSAVEVALRKESVNSTPGGPDTEKTPAGQSAPKSILTIDIGGTKVKILASGQTEPRKAPTGKGFTPARLVETVRGLAHDWEYEAISIGYPGLVGPHGPRSEPGNLGAGWVGFDFAAAFGKPVKMVNDAAMQALGSYEGGRMLFIGLGTGLGSALIAGHVIIPLELGHLLYDSGQLGEVLGRRGLERIGKGAWRRAVNDTVIAMARAFIADYVVIGGGNAKNIKDLPPGTRRGHNLTAFRGGFRLWSVEDVWVLAAIGGDSPQPTPQEALRML